MMMLSMANSIEDRSKVVFQVPRTLLVCFFILVRPTLKPFVAGWYGMVVWYGVVWVGSISVRVSWFWWTKRSGIYPPFPNHSSVEYWSEYQSRGGSLL